jgi:hypothetical protein
VEQCGESGEDGMANAPRCRPLTRPTSVARTSPLRPPAMAWAEATQAHVAWRERAGAMGGGTAASLR